MLPKAYDPAAVEDSIYKKWEESGAFRPENCDPNGEPFTISMPPPNATGQLHLGHAVMLALEDIFIRFARMRGKRALWVPGTDHAAIATESVVIKKIQKEEKIANPRTKYGREGLVAKIAEFVAQSQDTIRGQVRKMGSSCDWSRERYTMDPSLNRCVNEVFKKMYNDGLIYRGNRVVNWDTALQTTISDDEIEYKDTETFLYTIEYIPAALTGGAPVLVATSRPETKLGDTALVVHPDDERYKHLLGKVFTIDWPCGQSIVISVIADHTIDPAFGTGVLGLTPFHSKIDYEIWQRHKEEMEADPVQVIGEDGRMTDAVKGYAGMTVEECRAAFVEDLRAAGRLSKEEKYTQPLSVSYRSGKAVEVLPKLQWFIDVNKRFTGWSGKWTGQNLSLKQVMQDCVRSYDITIVPERFEKTYFQWIDNLQDWCISRQIWWGHRVPVWYDQKGNIHLKKQQRFILARHGQSTGNAAKVIQGQDDALTADGKKHAEKLAEMVKGRNITKIISSRSARAFDTAKIVAKQLKLEVEIWDELNAIDYGKLVGVPDTPDKLAIERALEEKTGETIEQFLKRAEAVWKKIQQEQSDGEILIVSHRTNFSALETIRKGGDKNHLIEERRSNETADFGLWGEIVLPDGTEDQTFEQDTDTLDTWFSSALWTWSTLIDPRKAADPSLSLEEILQQSPDYQNFHPTSVMETGYDILFFWVARMILMTTYATGQIPFKTVYLHGLIRTRDGKKMSKSHPETMIDPLDMIQKYGADALRLSMIVGQSPGADSRLYEEKIAGYRNFVNKLWNASRFVLMQCEEAKVDPKKVESGKWKVKNLSLADKALIFELDHTISSVEEGLKIYRLSEAGGFLYTFVWDFFCDWYLELSKGTAHCEVLVYSMRTILKLLHPYCPFVTEELWQHFSPSEDEMLMKQRWPHQLQGTKDARDPEVFDFAQARRSLGMLIEVIQAIRKIRADQGIEPGKEISVVIQTKKWAELLESQETHIRRLGKIRSLTFNTNVKPHKNAANMFLPEMEVYVPLEGLIDIATERKKLEREKAELEKYVQGIEAKLGNKDFTDRAPEKVIAVEKEKLKTHGAKLRKIEERLKILG